MFYESLKKNETLINQVLENNLNNNNNNKTLIERVAFYIVNLLQKQKELNNNIKIYDSFNILKQPYDKKLQEKIDKEINDELEMLKKIEIEKEFFELELIKNNINKKQSNNTNLPNILNNITTLVKTTTETIKIDNVINTIKLNNKLKKNDKNINKYLLKKKYENKKINTTNNNNNNNNQTEIKNKTLIPVTIEPKSNKNNETINLQTTTLNNLIYTNKITFNNETEDKNQTFKKLENNSNEIEIINPTNELITALIELQNELINLGLFNNTKQQNLFNKNKTNKVKYLK